MRTIVLDARKSQRGATAAGSAVNFDSFINHPLPNDAGRKMPQLATSERSGLVISESDPDGRRSHKVRTQSGSPGGFNAIVRDVNKFLFHHTSQALARWSFFLEAPQNPVNELYEIYASTKLTCSHYGCGRRLRSRVCGRACIPWRQDCGVRYRARRLPRNR